MAFDPIRRVAVLYGGDAPQQLHDTWLWDGSSWQAVSPAHEPAIGGVMAFDPASQSILLWGFTGTGFPPTGAETWRWTGTDWVRLDVQPAGSSMLKLDGYEFVLSPDPVTGRMMLVGHITANTPNTWEWDGSRWSLLGEVGPPGYQFNLAEDPASKTVIAEDRFGTWIWDGTRWGQTPTSGGPGHLQEAGMAYDSHDQLVLLFGGLDPDVAYGMRSNLWAWDGHTWTKL